MSLSGAFALGLFAQVGLFAHGPLLSGSLGERGAAVAVSLTTASAVVGRLALGALLGNIERRKAASANFLLQASGVVLLAVGQSPLIYLVGCVLFGLGSGNLISLPALITQKEFDAVDVPRAIALLTAIQQAMFSFGPAVLGALRDGAGTYTVPLLFAAAVQCLAALLVMMGRRLQ